MAVALVARVHDTQANQSFEATFERFPVRVGRNQLNDLPIDRPYVSQFHAAFDVKNDSQLFVRDLGSTNGTVHNGQRLLRDHPIDVTTAPQINIGPVLIHLSLVTAQPKPVVVAQQTGVLDLPDPAYFGRTQPGAEDPYVQQAVPFIEAYRQAWQTVYRLVYEHLARLPPELRGNYLRRVGTEHPSVSIESDFRKLAQYYGVDLRAFAAAGPAQAALAALAELSQVLAPQSKLPDDVPSVIGFSKRLKDSLEVFLKCFISLRDGYQEFETEVLARERTAMAGVAVAKDAKELGNVLLGHTSTPDTARQLHDIFVDVMSHQVALLNGIMEGVKTLLFQLSPRTLEAELEKSGKRGGLFSNRFEALWKLYEVRHADYSGEDKETFLIIFGSQFSKAYAATAGEAYKAGDKKLSRFTVPTNPRGRGDTG